MTPQFELSGFSCTVQPFKLCIITWGPSCVPQPRINTPTLCAWIYIQRFKNVELPIYPNPTNPNQAASVPEMIIPLYIAAWAQLFRWLPTKCPARIVPGSQINVLKREGECAAHRSTSLGILRYHQASQIFTFEAGCQHEHGMHDRRAHNVCCCAV